MNPMDMRLQDFLPTTPVETQGAEYPENLFYWLRNRKHKVTPFIAHYVRRIYKDNLAQIRNSGLFETPIHLSLTPEGKIIQTREGIHYPNYIPNSVVNEIYQWFQTHQFAPETLTKWDRLTSLSERLAKRMDRQHQQQILASLKATVPQNMVNNIVAATKVIASPIAAEQRQLPTLLTRHDLASRTPPAQQSSWRDRFNAVVAETKTGKAAGRAAHVLLGVGVSVAAKGVCTAAFGLVAACTAAPVLTTVAVTVVGAGLASAFAGAAKDWVMNKGTFKERVFNDDWKKRALTRAALGMAGGGLGALAIAHEDVIADKLSWAAEKARGFGSTIKGLLGWGGTGAAPTPTAPVAVPAAVSTEQPLDFDRIERDHTVRMTKRILEADQIPSDDVQHRSTQVGKPAAEPTAKPRMSFAEQEAAATDRISRAALKEGIRETVYHPDGTVTQTILGADNAGHDAPSTSPKAVDPGQTDRGLLEGNPAKGNGTTTDAPKGGGGAGAGMTPSKTVMFHVDGNPVVAALVNEECAPGMVTLKLPDGSMVQAEASQCGGEPATVVADNDPHETPDKIKVAGGGMGLGAAPAF